MPLWISIILLGIVEGITEFIPVSSTGHLLIAEHWLPHQTDLFNIVIQSGAVLAVIPLFHQRFHQFIFRWREPATLDYLLKIFVAFVITGIGGLIIDKHGFKLPEKLFPIAVALFVGGFLFVLIEYLLRGKTLRDEITWPVVIAVGFGQLLAAIFPGASRSGSTILLALILGLNRPLATEFSFLVGIPTMLAAGGLKIFQAFHHPAANAPAENWSMILLGTVVSAVVSFIAVKWLLRYVQTHTFIAFGWYRIVLAILIMLLLLTHPA
jgi:undecaprenyl-diphosphatase